MSSGDRDRKEWEATTSLLQSWGSEWGAGAGFGGEKGAMKTCS